MFGIGPQELLVVGLLALIVFGPVKAAGMARDFGRLVGGANRTVEEFKSELVPEELEEARRAVDQVKDEARRFAEEELGSKAAPTIDRDESATAPIDDDHAVSEVSQKGATEDLGDLRAARPPKP